MIIAINAYSSSVVHSNNSYNETKQQLNGPDQSIHQSQRSRILLQSTPRSQTVRRLQDRSQRPPRFRPFFHPPLLPSPTRYPSRPYTQTDTRPQLSVPVIDLSGPQPTVINQIRRSSSTLGFFRITNHGFPQSTIDAIISSVKSFNEQSTDVKAPCYHRDVSCGAAYSTNFDLFQSNAASWRDTMQIHLAPAPEDPGCVPGVCRVAAAEWDWEVVRVGEKLMGLLEEGLGLGLGLELELELGLGRQK